MGSAKLASLDMADKLAKEARRCRGIEDRWCSRKKISMGGRRDGEQIPNSRSWSGNCRRHSMSKRGRAYRCTADGAEKRRDTRRFEARGALGGSRTPFFFLPRQGATVREKPRCMHATISPPNGRSRLPRALVDTTGKRRMSEWPDESVCRTVWAWRPLAYKLH